MVSFGLSPKGKKQVKISVSKNKKSKLLDSDVLIYSSDFLWAKETAQIAKKLLGIQKIHFHKKLRERYFGQYDKTSLDNIKIAWAHDENNPNHKHKDVESPNKVLTRTMIAEHVWDYTFDSDTNIIDVYVNHLRNKIDKEPFKKVIHTVRGVGYILKEGEEK